MNLYARAAWYLAYKYWFSDNLQKNTYTQTASISYEKSNIGIIESILFTLQTHSCKHLDQEVQLTKY